MLVLDSGLEPKKSVPDSLKKRRLVYWVKVVDYAVVFVMAARLSTLLTLLKAEKS